MNHPMSFLCFSSIHNITWRRTGHKPSPALLLFAFIAAFGALLTITTPDISAADGTSPSSSPSTVGTRILDANGIVVPDGYVLVPKDNGLAATTFSADAIGTPGVDPEHYVTGPEYAWETMADPAGITTSVSASSPQTLNVTVASTWTGPVYTRNCTVTWIIRSIDNTTSTQFSLPVKLIIQKDGCYDCAMFETVFTNNHQAESGESLLRRDKSDFSETGTPFSTVEGDTCDWEPGMQVSLEPDGAETPQGNPASFTWDTKIKLTATAIVAPAGIPFTIRGASSNRYSKFTSNVQWSTGVPQEIELVADYNLPKEVKICNESIEWKICPPYAGTASDNMGKSIGIATHTFFITCNTPKNNICTEENYLFSYHHVKQVVEWATDGTQIDDLDAATNVLRKTQLGVKQWHLSYGYAMATGPQPDPFYYISSIGSRKDSNGVLGNRTGGDCICYADLMTKSLQVLGLDAGWRLIVCKNNGSNAGLYYAGGKTPYHYFFNVGWNFHGACSSGGRWWEITFNNPPLSLERGNWDADTPPSKMTSWPNGPVVKSSKSLMPQAMAEAYTPYEAL